MSNSPHDRPLRPHQLRDESATVELYDALALAGLSYGGVFLNWHYPREITDMSIAEFNKLELTEQDFLLLTTRPPMDDELSDKHPLKRTGSDLEIVIFNVLRKECFQTCKRIKIDLCEHLNAVMQPGFEKRLSSRFYSTGSDAPFMERNAKTNSWQRSDSSAGYLVHVPLGDGLPHLLAVFGMNGPLSLLWAYRLRTMRELAWVIEEPSFVMAEIVMTVGIPQRPVTLGFCDGWDVKIAAKGRLLGGAGRATIG
jgi:hypothetical protein